MKIQLYHLKKLVLALSLLLFLLPDCFTQTVQDSIPKLEPRDILVLDYQDKNETEIITIKGTLCGGPFTYLIGCPIIGTYACYPELIIEGGGTSAELENSFASFYPTTTNQMESKINFFSRFNYDVYTRNLKLQQHGNWFSLDLSNF